jgi:hypothetical protein
VVVAEEMIVGEVFGLSGSAVGMTGFALQATHTSTTNNRITNILPCIEHLIKRDSLLALYANPHPPARHNLHA